jgi:hypothetical protein
MPGAAYASAQPKGRDHRLAARRRRVLDEEVQAALGLLRTPS